MFDQYFGSYQSQDNTTKDFGWEGNLMSHLTSRKHSGEGDQKGDYTDHNKREGNIHRKKSERESDGHRINTCSDSKSQQHQPV